MADWLSSKLKVAETFLQQIDQQAAESLRKNDKLQSPSSLSPSDAISEIPNKIDSLPSSPPPPPALKYQLPKRAPPPPPSPSPAPPPHPDATAHQPPPPSDPAAIDWTELLSSPSPNPIAALNGRKTKNSSSNNNHVKKPLIPLAPALDKKKDADLPSTGDGSKAESADLVRDDEEPSGSSSESEDSGTDSEDERQRREERRKRREQMIAERAAAAAAKAIKDREDAVARLEGEKESLEKILAEREKQQAQEASELQMKMMETMEAVDLEKQKHNSTRMEAFARLAELETTNAELARSLATAQWNLEIEVKRISELQQQIELKELAQEEHKRRMLKIHQKRASPSNEEPPRKDELEQEILDAEYSFISNKIALLKDKAKMLEENIENTRRERVYPSEMEVEMRRRLTQLTDHLIQKQTQVEALSSEKASLSLRIEMLSRLLDENGLSDVSNGGSAAAAAQTSYDIEGGTWLRPSKSKSEALHERIRSGRRQLGSLIEQFDILFSAGSIFIRRNPMAQIWAILYLLCLHVWVVYILFSPHSQVSDAHAGHGAVYSLEIINKTSAYGIALT